MPTYVTLLKFTEQGIKNIKNDKKNREAAFKNAEKMGLKVIGLYALMGEYDALLIFECPNDEAAIASAIGASSDGNARTTTLRAFTVEEFDKILDKLP